MSENKQSLYMNISFSGSPEAIAGFFHELAKIVPPSSPEKPQENTARVRINPFPSNFADPMPYERK